MFKRFTVNNHVLDLTGYGTGTDKRSDTEASRVCEGS